MASLTRMLTALDVDETLAGVTVRLTSGDRRIIATPQPFGERRFQCTALIYIENGTLTYAMTFATAAAVLAFYEGLGPFSLMGWRGARYAPDAVPVI